MSTLMSRMGEVEVEATRDPIKDMHNMYEAEIAQLELDADMELYEVSLKYVEDLETQSDIIAASIEADGTGLTPEAVTFAQVQFKSIMTGLDTKENASKLTDELFGGFKDMDPDDSPRLTSELLGGVGEALSKLWKFLRELLGKIWDGIVGLFKKSEEGPSPKEVEKENNKKIKETDKKVEKVKKEKPEEIDPIEKSIKESKPYTKRVDTVLSMGIDISKLGVLYPILDNHIEVLLNNMKLLTNSDIYPTNNIEYMKNADQMALLFEDMHKSLLNSKLDRLVTVSFMDYILTTTIDKGEWQGSKDYKVSFNIVSERNSKYKRTTNTIPLLSVKTMEKLNDECGTILNSVDKNFRGVEGKAKSIKMDIDNLIKGFDSATGAGLAGRLTKTASKLLLDMFRILSRIIRIYVLEKTRLTQFRKELVDTTLKTHTEIIMKHF